MPDALPADLIAPARPRRPDRRSRRMEVAALVSVALHAALLGSVWLWVRHKKPVVLLPASSPPVVQLVMTPPGGKPHAASARRAPIPTARAAKPQEHPAPRQEASAKMAMPDKAAKDSVTALPPMPRTGPTKAAKPARPPLDTQVKRVPREAEKVAAALAAPQQPPAQASARPDDQLSINLPQAESDTNAWVTGNDILPPTANVKYHNRKPSYPPEAALRGEQGKVVLLIHVGADGLVQGVSVLQSSGYASLDRAAIDAVRTWHFLPSIRNGQPVPATMPARFVFELD